jgi:hypothetical protein
LIVEIGNWEQALHSQLECLISLKSYASRKESAKNKVLEEIGFLQRDYNNWHNYSRIAAKRFGRATA